MDTISMAVEHASQAQSHENPHSLQSSTTTAAEEYGALTPLSASSSSVNLSAVMKGQEALTNSEQRQSIETFSLLAVAKSNAAVESLVSATHGTQTPPAEQQEPEQPVPYYATSALTEAMGTSTMLSKPVEFVNETPIVMNGSYYLPYAGQLEGGEDDPAGSDEQYQDDLLNDSGFGLPTRVQTISTTHPDPSNPNGPPVTTISYLCPWEGCAKSFSRYFNLRSHYRIHSGEKPYVCPDCNLAFARNHDLKRHARIHSGQKPYLCPHCRKTFSRNDAMSRHVRLASCLARGPPASRDGSSIINLDDMRLGTDSHHGHGPHSHGHGGPHSHGHGGPHSHGHGPHSHGHGPHSQSHGYTTSGMLMEDNGRRRSGLRYNEKDDLNYFRGHPSEREDMSDAIGEPHSVGMRGSPAPFTYSSTLPRLVSPVQSYGSGSGMPGLYSTPSPYYGESSPVAATTPTTNPATTSSLNPHDHQQHPSSHYGNGAHSVRSAPLHFTAAAPTPYYGHAQGHHHQQQQQQQQQHHPYYTATRFPSGNYGGNSTSSMNMMMHPMPNPAYPHYQPSHFTAFPYNNHGNMTSASPSPSSLKAMPPRYNEDFHTSSTAPHSMPSS